MAPITVAQRSRQLLKAIKEERLDVVTRLLAEGVDLEFEDRQGLTALRSAAQEGHIEVISLRDSETPWVCISLFPNAFRVGPSLQKQ